MALHLQPFNLCMAIDCRQDYLLAELVRTGAMLRSGGVRESNRRK